MRRTWLLDALAILVLTSTLIWPLFQLAYLDHWRSIESTFIADGRMMGENLPSSQLAIPVQETFDPRWYACSSGTRSRLRRTP